LEARLLTVAMPRSSHLTVAAAVLTILEGHVLGELDGPQGEGGCDGDGE
jgi:hypothetical protein